MTQQVDERAERSAEAGAQVELAVSGMTCGSCAARVEKVLNRLDGVSAAGVNFATERASVTFDPASLSVDDLVAAVAKIGYGALPIAGEAGDEDEAAGAEAADEARQRRQWLLRVLVAWPLGLGVLVLSMAFMHEPWARWSAFALTVPVQFWAGYPFLHQAAVRAKALQANMDTLIAIGTLGPPSPTRPTTWSSARPTRTTTSTALRSSSCPAPR